MERLLHFNKKRFNHEEHGDDNGFGHGLNGLGDRVSKIERDDGLMARCGVVWGSGGAWAR
jgi:hypothetical protein